jgi:hypothetical protein
MAGNPQAITEPITLSSSVLLLAMDTPFADKIAGESGMFLSIRQAFAFEGLAKL